MKLVQSNKLSTIQIPTNIKQMKRRTLNNEDQFEQNADLSVNLGKFNKLSIDQISFYLGNCSLN